ncbi:MAG: transcriptional repressor NrdR [Bacillati bacterium ANGP1]|uniref:Transcriptional repressor NrdR n=1 Tax=Candidatus Segetimicrobium genomatis TaxID=2569760 RepID=A0A537M0F8_9BACT|nr:MAG: transcriptional repressor NrdR [Terrabacteria group bacterium ANGP1]
MRCPYCAGRDSRVLDSRGIDEGDAIRRRRECLGCRRRFTTFERAERLVLHVIKRDGRRETFDRLKVLTGMLRACEGRPVPREVLERTAAEIERELLEGRGADVSSREIGDRVIERLRRMDDVAYVRFASVYRRVGDVDRLVEEIQRLKARKQLEAELQTQIELLPFLPQHPR